MGDLVEITTIPKQQHIFYKVTSGCLRFKVKGPSSAGIGLSNTTCYKDIVWFVLGRNGMSSVHMYPHYSRKYHLVPTPSILSAHEFREFWIQWHSDLMCLGRDDAVAPFIMHHKKDFVVKYITFGSYDQYAPPLQWSFELPPLRKYISIKPVSDGIPKWVHADSQLPDGALIGGYENEILYIIRAPHQGSLTPGKFAPSYGAGYIPWGGDAHEKGDLEVLCGYDCIWLPCSNNAVPSGAVEGGHSEIDHETLYVGRARYKNHIIPGKVQPSHKVCYIPYEDKEIAVNNYEILVIPLKNVHCSNPYFLENHAIKML